jgi:anaerobic magnesium-protoporphyrin IX monomethyl ester cyclase
MISVLLIYPYFKPSHDRSVFRFPPLGVSYIAASLREAGYDVHLLDCTFLSRNEALKKAQGLKVDVVGIYCMVTMMEDSRWFAQQLRGQCKLMVAGGPLPTCSPELFLDHFDVVVRGEGEQTMRELLCAVEQEANLSAVAGIVYRKEPSLLGNGIIEPVFTTERPFIKDLESIPFPARDLLSNEDYIRYGKQKYGYSITTVMSTRGCPFRCEFCSNVIFGGTYRERSAQDVVDEIESVLELGYDRISFADDVFTLNASRVTGICREIHRRKLNFQWECLGRVDALQYSTMLEMKEAGCVRIYFGIESGSDEILKQMNKKISAEQARKAVEDAHRAGLEVGAFFILFYPGETNDTILQTLRFATSLPLDYLGLTMPYPLPGTALYERIKEKVKREWRQDESVFGSHVLIFQSDFSEVKMRFGILKGQVQHRLKRRFGKPGRFLSSVFEKPTDVLLRLLK